MGQESGSRWLPDARTINWCFGAADEAKIRGFMQSDVENRLAGVSCDSEEYWSILTEIAVESTLFYLLNRAKEMGVVFDSKND